MRVTSITVLITRLLPIVSAVLFLSPLSAYAAGPDLSVAKSCAVNGPQSILCTVTISNIGNVSSVSPMSLTDTVTGSSNVNLSGAGGTLPTSCTPGAQLINNIPINCNINTSMAAGASGTALFSFTMPQGGTFTNCVSVSQAQNAATLPDPDLSNNTNICTTITVPTPAPVTGSITIVKDAQPNDAQNFTFTSDQASIAPFPLDDDSDSTLSNQRTFSGLPAGSYTFTETQVSGWTLASVSCTPSSGTSSNLSAGSATITLAAGGNVTCTYVNTNRPNGTLTIVKDARPDAAQDFHYTVSGAGLTDFTLDDDGANVNPLSNSITFTNLAAGIPFTVTEDAVSGWTVPSLQCLVAVPGQTTTFTDQLNRTFTVNLEAGANVTCTFLNVYTPPPNTAKICGIKFNDLNGNGVQDAGELGLANWQISLGIATVPPVTTGSKGEYCLTGLPAGSYTVSEISQAPWMQTFPVAPGAHAVTLAAGQQLNGINFGNTIPSGPCNDLSGSPYIMLGNGSFELAPLVSPGTFSFFDQGLVPSWSTSAPDGQIEVWANGFGGIPAYSGNHFLELNAKVGATLYQDFTAIPGSTVTITFAHRGRSGFPNQMSVGIGPVGGLPVTLGSYTAVTTAWTLNSITYTFPNNGQTAYQIGFTSGDAGAGGNFLDAIQMIDVACADVVVPDDATLTKPKVFTFVESTYPDLFKGAGVAGQSQQYSYRFYAQSGNYLAIDDMGTIFMLGSFTDNIVTTLGTTDALRHTISVWYAGPPANSRVFNFAEGNYPSIFRGTPVVGQLEQYSYRFYPQSGNYIAIDNAGMLYVLGAYTGNTLVRVGEVASLSGAITAWEAGLPRN